MTQVVGVRFKDTGKVYFFDPNGLDIKTGSFVIVETARGIECGRVAEANKTVEDDEIVSPLKPVIRIATDADMKVVEENRIKEQKAFEICEKKIAEHSLDMNLTEVEYTFDGSKIVFYFTAESRVDFRELVKDLASTFHSRIRALHVLFEI